MFKGNRRINEAGREIGNVRKGFLILNKIIKEVLTEMMICDENDAVMIRKISKLNTHYMKTNINNLKAE